jgi:lambda repressor-like predicted transcriptional regulator
MDCAKITKDEIIDYQKRFKTDTAIARALGVAKYVITANRKRYGIPSTRVLNEKRNECICDLYKKGMSIREISKRVGFSETGIRYILFEKSWKVKKGEYVPKMSTNSRSELIRLGLQKILGKDEAIAIELGISRQRVWALRAKYEIPPFRTKAIN